MMYRRGLLSSDELWAATRFATGFEAMLTPYTVRAANLEWSPKSSDGSSPAERPLSYAEAIFDYQRVSEAMRRRDPLMPNVVIAVSVNCIGTERLDGSYQRRKGWAVGLFRDGLRIYLAICGGALKRDKSRGFV